MEITHNETILLAIDWPNMIQWAKGILAKNTDVQRALGRKAKVYPLRLLWRIFQHVAETMGENRPLIGRVYTNLPPDVAEADELAVMCDSLNQWGQREGKTIDFQVVLGGRKVRQRDKKYPFRRGDQYDPVDARLISDAKIILNSQTITDVVLAANDTGYTPSKENDWWIGNCTLHMLVMGNYHHHPLNLKVLYYLMSLW